MKEVFQGLTAEQPEERLFVQSKASCYTLHESACEDPFLYIGRPFRTESERAGGRCAVGLCRCLQAAAARDVGCKAL